MVDFRKFVAIRPASVNARPPMESVWIFTLRRS
jgi:hypothetical protein